MVSGYQNGTIAQLLQAIIGQINFDGEPISNIGDILLSILEQTPYDDEPKSVLAELFLKLKDKLEGRAFTPYDKEPKSVIAEILLSILNETEYDKEPNSRIAELLLELKAELESYAEITVSGSVANFTTSVVKPLVNLKAYFEATQEAGTPTPQSPKAISGVSAVSVKHSGADMTDYDEYIVNLGGTYYGGYVEQDKDGKRELVDTYSNLVNLSDLTFYPTTKGGHICFYADLPNGVIKSGGEQAFSGKCSTYTVTSNLTMPNDLTCLFYCSELYGGYTRILIRDDSASTMTGAQFAAYVTGRVTYEKANPQTVALPDGEPILAFNGVNNVWNDSGDTSVTYLAKIEDNLRSTAKFRANLKAEKQKLKEQKELKELEEKETIKEPIKEIGETKK